MSEILSYIIEEVIWQNLVKLFRSIKRIFIKSDNKDSDNKEKE